MLFFMLIAWLIPVLRLAQSGESLNFLVWTLPIFLLMCSMKPPQLSQVHKVSLVFALAVIVCGLIALVFGLVGLSPSSFGIASGLNRFQFLVELGIDGRWFGPFVHSNLAGPVGGAVFLIGLSQRSVVRVFVVSGGGLILALSQSRTGLFATLTVTLWWFVLCSDALRSRIRKPLRVFLLFMPILLAALYVAVFDSTLAWRTYAWADFAGIWWSSPIFGGATVGIEDYMAAGKASGPSLQSHAHNLLIDGAARWGIAFFVLICVIAVMSMWLAVSALRFGSYQGFVLVSFVLLVGLVETPFDWIHLTPLMFVFLLGVLSSVSAHHDPHGAGGANRVRVAERD